MGSMKMRNCKKCGKIFPYIRNPICSNCEEEETQCFETVRSYLKENPNHTIETVSEETGVSVKKILRFIKEGKIDTSEGMSGILKCEKCGTSINIGKYCEKCATKMEDKLSKMIETANAFTAPVEKNKSARMYTQEEKPRTR